MIQWGDHFGLKINNYYDFEIRGNTFLNLKTVALNAYTAVGISRIAWGNNFTISGNTMKNVNGGIRFSQEAAVNGFQNVPQNLVITGNTLAGKTEAASNVSAIREEDGIAKGISITDKKSVNSIICSNAQN